MPDAPAPAAAAVRAINSFHDPRFVISYTIILLFAGAYVWHPDATMNGALIAAFAGAWGFYLGSSKGGSTANESVGNALDLAARTAPPPAPTTILKPGETAQAAPDPQQ